MNLQLDHSQNGNGELSEQGDLPRQSSLGLQGMVVAWLRLLLILVLLCGGFAFLIQPAVDPPVGRGFENRIVEDGLAPLDFARSISGEIGAPVVTDGAPLVSIPASIIYRFAGVSLGSSRVLAGISILLLAWWGAMTIWHRYGPVFGVSAGFLLIFHGACFSLGRAPLVIPLVTLSAVGLLSLASRRSWWAPVVSILMLPLAAKAVHPTIMFIAPALFIECLCRCRLLHRVFAHFTFPAAVCTIGTLILLWLGLPAETRVDWCTRLGAAPSVDGPSLLSVLPAVLPLAWFGLVHFWMTGAEKVEDGRRLERVVLASVWIPIGLRATVGDVTATACAELIPLIVWLAVLSLARFVQSSSFDVTSLQRGRGALLCLFGCLGSWWLLLMSRQLYLSEYDGVFGLPIVLVCLFTGLTVLSATVENRRMPRVLLLMVVSLVSPAIWESAQILGHPGSTLKRSCQALDRTVLPTAQLTGHWARVLTLENDVAWAVDDSRSGSHRLHREDELVDGFSLRKMTCLGQTLEISRIGDTESAWSAFELGRKSERDGDFERARNEYFLVLRGDPEHSPTWERIAYLLLAEQEIENGYRCLLNALYGNPRSPSIQCSLASLYLDHNHYEDAEYHLRRAVASGADPRETRLLWDRLNRQFHSD